MLTELENDADLSAAILEASGLDVLHPPAPAERLRAEYLDIINSRPILDKYAPDGTVYTVNGLTYASEGLSYAAILDFDGNGTDELLLVTQHRMTYGPGPLTKLEVYGDSMGYAALTAETDLSEYKEEYGWAGVDPFGYSYDHTPTHFGLAESNRRIYAVMDYGIQDVQNTCVFAIGNNELTLVEYSDYDGVSNYSWDWELTEEQNLCPPLPADVQMKNALMACLDTYGEPFDFCYAKLADTDLYALYGDGSFEKFSWNGAELEYTNFENDILYAKLIDMDQDGAEELFFITEYDSGPAVAYSWKGTSWERTLLCEGALEYLGLYRDTEAGNIYLGVTDWRSIGRGETVAFYGLTDHFEYTIDLSDFISNYDSYEELPPDEREEVDIKFAEAFEEHERDLERVELIEDISPYLSGNNYELFAQMDYTVEEVRQQLTAR